MRNFTEGNIFRHLAAFSTPLIIGEFLNSLYIIVDAAWVGRLMGSDALAAVAISFPLIFTLYSLVLGFPIATSILVGQSYGKEKGKSLQSLLSHSFASTMIMCFFVSGLGLVFCIPLLKLINTPKNILSMAAVYFAIMMAGSPVRAMQDWNASVLKGLGNSKMPLALLALSVILNIILAPLLIMGTGPLPELGIAGSAIATILSIAFAAGVGYLYLKRKGIVLHILRWDWQFETGLLKKICRIGMPASVQMLIKGLSWLLLTAIVALFGTTATAAYGIGVRIDTFAFMAAFSVGIAASSMTAQNIGAGKYDRVRETLQKAIRLSLAYSAAFFVVVNLFPGAIASIFTRDDSLREMTCTYLRIVSWGYLLFALSFSLQGVIQGSGHTKALMFFTLLSMFAVRIPLAYALSVYTPLAEKGIWYAIVASSGLGLILNWGYYTYGRWLRR